MEKNPFKVGDAVAFKADNTEDGRLFSKEEALIVSHVTHYGIMFHGNDSLWLHGAFRLVMAINEDGGYTV